MGIWQTVPTVIPTGGGVCCVLMIALLQGGMYICTAHGYSTVHVGKVPGGSSTPSLLLRYELAPFYPNAFSRAAITVECKPAEGRVGPNDFSCLLPFSCPLFPQVPRRTAPFSPLRAGRAPTPHWRRRRSGRTGGAGRCVRRAAGGSTA